MIVFAATPIPNPEFLNLKYVNKTVPTPAPTRVVPRMTLPIPANLLGPLLDALLAASVDRFLQNDDFVFSTTLKRVNWLLVDKAVREPTMDTLERSVIDGSPQLGCL
jgi:hypothetical protein